MVIFSGIDERIQEAVLDVNLNGGPYVYLVDDEQDMMLILKRDLDKINGSNSTDQDTSVEQFVVEKVKNLLDRISHNGPLTNLEIKILNYAAIGKSNKQIAELMERSESTIKNHFFTIMKKLNANDRTHAVTLALCYGWLKPTTLCNMMPNSGTIE